MRDESGVTLTELMVSMAAALVVLTGILGLVQVTTTNQAKVAHRVAANQKARPAMTHIVNQLRSACVAPGVAPVLEGSTSTLLSFVSKSGSEPSPTPDKREISMVGDALQEKIYPAVGGAPPNWSFATQPSTTRQLVKGVGLGSAGEPPSPVPVFSYYRYVGGQISPTPLETPLKPEDAPRTVQVNITFATSSLPVDPAGSPPAFDPKSPITLSDSVSLRLEPAAEDASEVNLPCV